MSGTAFNQRSKVTVLPITSAVPNDGLRAVVLPASVLEQVKKNDAERAWVLEILSEVELIVDSYEQPIPRPTDNQEQKKNYSGKQKRHTKKKPGDSHATG
ncbi:MAG: hypothetical protein P2A85_25420 [Microcoleus anatoxicus]